MLYRLCRQADENICRVIEVVKFNNAVLQAMSDPRKEKKSKEEKEEEENPTNIGPGITQSHQEV
jgi:hypothetical protein